MTTVLIFTVGLIAFLAVILVGLYIPAPIRTPQECTAETTEPDHQETSLQHLPPTQRRIAASLGEQQSVRQPLTAVVWGNGKIVGPKAPLLGQLWIPISWTLYLRPGQEFIWRAHFTWFRSTKMTGGDEWRNGRGRFLAGETRTENENMDRGEATALWLYSLAFTPAALFLDPRLGWEAIDEDNLLMRQPYGEETWEYHLHMQPHNGPITRIDTRRTASRDGQNIPYHLELAQHRSFGAWTLPGHVAAAWNDEPPFLHLHVAGVAYDLPIDETLRRGILNEDPAEPEPQADGEQSEG